MEGIIVKAKEKVVLKKIRRRWKIIEPAENVECVLVYRHDVLDSIFYQHALGDIKKQLELEKIYNLIRKHQIDCGVEYISTFFVEKEDYNNILKPCLRK